MAMAATSTSGQWISLSITITIILLSRKATILTIIPRIMSQTTSPRIGIADPNSFWQVWRNGGYRGRMCRKSTREVRISLTGIWHAEIKILMVLGVATNFLSPAGGEGVEEAGFCREHKILMAAWIEALTEES